MSAELSEMPVTSKLWQEHRVREDGTRRAQVLVVDDENGPRQALRMLLKEAYDVHLASNVVEALAVLEGETIDLVITDIRMPQRSGMDLLRQIREKHPDIQVIILTGYAQLDTAMKAVEYGAFAYLEKPFDSDKMFEYVRAGLEKRRQEQERRAQEFLALEANRFETLGRLISGMMHDLGTPLTVIGSNIELLMNDPNREDMSERLQTINSQAVHCNEMVRAAMNFLRSDTLSRGPFCISNVVQTCLKVAQPLLRRQRIDVATELEPDSASCIGEVVLVRQALLNLITNACHAMQDQEEARQITIRTWTEQDYACLSIQDTGPGIAPELRSKVFDTFFTTKGDRGTGLGLAVVRNVMRRHNSSITLADHPGRGALFTLKFPIAPREELLRTFQQA